MSELFGVSTDYLLKDDVGEEVSNKVTITETESRETLDEAAKIFRELYALAHENPEDMHTAPHNAQIGRPDEVQAARNPVLRWKKT